MVVLLHLSIFDLCPLTSERYESEWQAHLMLRYYKAEPERFRPVDRMIAHTGYLIFARPILVDRVEDQETLLAIEGRRKESDNDPNGEEVE